MTDEEYGKVMDLVRKMSEDDEKANIEKAFKDWCSSFEAVPSDFEYRLKDGLRAYIEPQPYRWMSLGLEMLQSSKGTASVRHRESQLDRPINSYLVYPVFQMGTEIFLKGMWLCQFDDYRKLHDFAYINKERREECDEGLIGLGHDLLKIIEAVRGIPQYAKDEITMQFLRRVEGMIRDFYFPSYEAQKRAGDWATARYPKRFYNDQAQKAKSDMVSRYPPQWVIARLFEEMEDHVDQLWKLRSELWKQQAEATI
jgi:hypothetical protein